MHDAAPCACTTVRVSAEQLRVLRSAFSACLCVPCLRELASGSPMASRVTSR
ncbi:MAG: cysteine-rich CWC family protein [Burkholderiaceae bacterium]|nr:cysteine-rich CWC family protein [Burkholderiaceae bacterium]